MRTHGTRRARGPSSRAATRSPTAASTSASCAAKKGVDYPFDGGSARVTGHYICNACPRANGNAIPRYVLSGPKGVFRGLVKDADLAIIEP